MNRVWRVWAVSLPFIHGCAVGPTYAPPAPQAGAYAPFVSMTATAETTAIPGDRWWQLYRDPLLDRLLMETLSANTDLRIATANLSAAHSVLEAARDGRYPQTLTGAGAKYGRDPGTDEILELGGHAPKNIWIFDPLLDASYEIDMFGRVRRSIEAAHADEAATNAARDGIKVLLIAEATRAYAQICSLGEQLEVARRSAALVLREARITGDRYEAGASSQFEVVRADGLVARVNADIPPLEGERRSALFELAALLGRPPSRAPSEVEKCVTPPGLVHFLPVGSGASMLKRRPDVREAERRLAAATARIGIATADLYPTITFKGFVGGISSHLSQLTTNKALAWGIGPSVSWAFPNQAGPRARIHQANANAEAALAAFDGVVLKALKETEQALARYGADIDRRRSLDQAQLMAQQAFDMAHSQFLAGAISDLDRLVSEQTLVTANATAAQSDGALIRDQIAIFEALGGGWQ